MLLFPHWVRRIGLNFTVKMRIHLKSRGFETVVCCLYCRFVVGKLFLSESMEHDSAVKPMSSVFHGQIIQWKLYTVLPLTTQSWYWTVYWLVRECGPICYERSTWCWSQVTANRAGVCCYVTVCTLLLSVHWIRMLWKTCWIELYGWLCVQQHVEALEALMYYSYKYFKWWRLCFPVKQLKFKNAS